MKKRREGSDARFGQTPPKHPILPQFKPKINADFSDISMA